MKALINIMLIAVGVVILANAATISGHTESAIHEIYVQLIYLTGTIFLVAGVKQ